MGEGMGVLLDQRAVCCEVFHHSEESPLRRETSGVSNEG